ncbi:MAG: rod shape-determining protein [Clostridia bacterium]|nr:rod shape-determining protein [Clostridia bacterium]
MPKLIGIDLGTSNTRIFVKDKKKIVMRAPSAVSLDRETREVLASGRAAKLMLGKTPGSILAIRPLKQGVITDLEVTSLMVRDFLDRLQLLSAFDKPQVLVSVPSGITEVERRAVEDAICEAGARSAVGIIDTPIAAAVGAGIHISKARGAMLVDLGGGVSEASVISLGGVVHAKALRVGGDDFDQAIIHYLKQNRSLLIGDVTAEVLKIRIGAAVSSLDRGKLEICGRDLRPDADHMGLARVLSVTSAEVCAAIREPLREILSMIKSTLEETPPELASDIYDFGIVLTGSASLLPGMAELIQSFTGVRVIQIKQPGDAVAIGLGRMLKNAGRDFSDFIRYKPA